MTKIDKNDKNWFYHFSKSEKTENPSCREVHFLKKVKKVKT